MANGNGAQSGGYSPLWYAIGAIILIGLMMGTIVLLKPLQFKPVAAVHCEGEACAPEAAPPAGAPQGVSHEAAPPAHGE